MYRTIHQHISRGLRLTLCGTVLLSMIGRASAQTLPSAVVQSHQARSQSEGTQLCDDNAEEGTESEEQHSFCQHRRQGLAFYDAQRYREAIDELTLAYRIYPAPRILYKIGYAHRKLGDLREARQFLSMFLSVDATIPMDQRRKIEATLLDLQQQISQMEKSAPSRPRWRLGVGAGLNGAGAILLGFGIPALAVDSSCVRGPAIPGAQCPDLFQTTTIGRGLVVPGALLMVAGTLTAAWPVIKRSERSSSRQQIAMRKE